MKLLALHGWGQDAALFGSKRTKDLQKRLKSLPLVLDCADAPFVVGASPAERGWWTYRPEDWDGSLSNPLELLSRESFAPIGLDVSLDQLSERWRDGDYDGILGFSQGAVMGAILCAKLCVEPGARRPRCAILISGFANPSPVGLSYYPPAQPLDVPSLHIWGAGDTHIPPTASEALSQRFLQPAVHVHPAHHFIPQKPNDCKVFSAFLTALGPATATEPPGPLSTKPAGAAAKQKPAQKRQPAAQPVAAPAAALAAAPPTRAGVTTVAAAPTPVDCAFYVAVGQAVWCGCMHKRDHTTLH